MNARRALTIGLIIGLMAALLPGCMQDRDDLQGFVAEVRSRPSPPIEPIPEFQSYTPYAYVAGDRRPPFTPVVDTRDAMPTSTSGIRPNVNRPLDPLEAFPLDSLTMVGTMIVDGVRYALIHAPDDVVYRAAVGEHAGKDYGEITAITDTAVKLSEIVPDGRGGYMRRPARIPLTP